MNNTKLSLCMIVKDEAANLATCLESVSGLVNEIILVDTGSVDNTKEIARAMGANVFSFPWNNDFSEARNESLRYASGDWILVLDADEVIDPGDHSRIHKLLSKRQVDGYRLIQRTYQRQSTVAGWKALEDNTPFARGCPGYIPSPLVRLFRNLPELRFRGRVHELIEYDLLFQRRVIVNTDIPIHHYGKVLDARRLKRKQTLYRMIGEDKLKDQPADARACCELGVQYIEMNLYDQAERVLKRALAIDPQNIRAMFNLAIALSRLGEDTQAIHYYQQVIELDPTHIGAYNNLAQIFMRHDEMVEKADRIFQIALHRNPQHHVLHYNYGLFWEKKGRFLRAKNQYQKALAIDDGFDPARNRLERIHQMQREERRMLNENRPDTNTSNPCILKGPDTNEPDRQTVSLSERNKLIEDLNALITGIEQNPNNSDLRFRCGYALERLGQKDAALEQYQEALKLNPTHSGVLFQLAVEAENQGLLEDSITLYRELLKESPHHIEAHLNLARILEKQEEQKKALKSDTAGLRIAFLWGGIPFCGDTLNKKALGGTETAIIHMASCLASMGHKVKVFVKDGNGLYNGVLYDDIQNYVYSLRQEPADILIACRLFHPFLHQVDARVRIFWTEDAHDQPFVQSLDRWEITKNIDRIFTVSRWQTNMLSSRFNIPIESFFITRNGVYWKHFQTIPESKNQRKLVYTSTPFRGLDVLLDIFPQIRKRVPDAELDIFSSMQVYQIDKSEDEAMYGDLYRKADQPGVVLKGSVTQSELARALLSSGIMAYPNHFAETSCIAALEALAAAVPVVTTSLGALPETVCNGGVLIDGDPRTDEYQSRFVDVVCTLMLDTNRWNFLGKVGRKRIYEQNRWQTIVREWTMEFNRLLASKAGKHPVKTFH
ncbi:MAG: tetratricopeptide repeat protein [Deltaproteobacteria bacterium]|nr:tetratricopeptide repeat protein [Deltaproteobacteria bacterium]MBW2153514.1 tetratricopeptide repeat protein [Deltaproteobacteria bacterium]